MLDVKFIRQNIDEVKEKLMTRGVNEEVLNEFVILDQERRNHLVKVETLKKLVMMCLKKLLL